MKVLLIPDWQGCTIIAYPVDYEEIVDNATIMKKNSKVILVREQNRL